MFSFKRQVGNRAEVLALAYLSARGLTLIAQNYLTRVGEIDLIMLDNAEQTLVFVEVRYRASARFGKATDTVSSAKQQKLIRTAHLYLQQHDEFEDFICRFDVIGLESDLKCPTFNWIQNAFDG